MFEPRGRKRMERKLDGNYTRKLRAVLTSPGTIADKTAAVQPSTTHHEKPSKLDEPEMQDTAGEVKTNS